MTDSKQSYNRTGAYLPKDNSEKDTLVDELIASLGGDPDESEIEKMIPELNQCQTQEAEPLECKPKQKKIVHRFKVIAPKPAEIKPVELKQYLKPISKLVKTGPITKQEYYERHPEKKLEKVLDYSAYPKPESKPFYSRIFDCGKKLYSRIFG